MSQDARLKTLLVDAEKSEVEATRERLRIERVVDEREAMVSVLEEKKRSLEGKQDLLGQKIRAEALPAGDASSLRSLTSYQQRLRRELEALEEEIARKIKELERAREYDKRATTEEIEARVERKKIEKLIDAKEQKKRISEVARDESAGDELSQVLKKE